MSQTRTLRISTSVASLAGGQNHEGAFNSCPVNQELIAGAAPNIMSAVKGFTMTPHTTQSLVRHSHQLSQTEHFEAAQRHRRLLVRQVLIAELYADEDRSATARINLDLQGEYPVYYLCADSEEDMAATARALRPYMLTLLVEPGVRRVIGIALRPPHGSMNVPIGVSAPRPLDRLRASLDEAERASEVAVALRLRRCVTADELPLLSAVLALPVTGAELVDRCFGHITGEQRASTVRTVDAYLAAGGSADQAASALFVHPNTVRYRLRRLTEDTGLSLARTPDTLMLWWAVRHLQATHPVAQ